ncbi:hypothetical protein CLV59_10887 [Chitinophaga dinghuensis]|uniref:DUF4468 domain-containing protein n=1 Tax=Chitinophaga dinghuensis TaxID=1539050 RepID=A0A327VRI8_9BACT|nr:hypothetical protein [Chitinophaga dinghuensis]RAJ76568.1 hypothetical protein CLV59_10887 [Chitinophaga dinghuensis]
MLKLTTQAAKLLLLIAGIVCYLPRQAAAQSSDRLDPFDPGKNAIDSYYNNLYQKLLWRFADRPIARVVVVPPFSPEYALSVEEDASGYLLKSNIRVAYFDAASQQRVVVDQPMMVSRRINRELAIRIQQLFNVALRQTGAPADPGLDGVKYFFTAYTKKYGFMRAQTVSPAAATRTGALVKICHQLIAYAKGQSNGEDSLLRNINVLTNKFESLNNVDLAITPPVKRSMEK